MSILEHLYLGWVFIASGIGLILMGYDKIAAKIGAYRVPEMGFHFLSLIGGVFGVVLGILLFHHKIRKPTFKYPQLFFLLIHTIIVLSILLK